MSSTIIHLVAICLLAIIAATENVPLKGLQLSFVQSRENLNDSLLTRVETLSSLDDQSSELIEAPVANLAEVLGPEHFVSADSMASVVSGILAASELRTDSVGFLESDHGDVRDEVGLSKTPGSGIPRHRGMLSARSGAQREPMLLRYGGTEATEDAVRLGLEWLMRQQARDGSWSFLGPYSDRARFGENRVAATAMALLAILGAGHTHQSGQYKEQVNAALKWLVAQQNRGGLLGEGTPRHHGLYTHAQSTLVLTEAYIMTNDSWLRPFCEKAVAYAVRAQGPKGGWRYELRGDSDTSVTGWFMIALISGRSAGFDVPDSCLRRIHGWLNRVDQQDGALYSYVERFPTTPAMTAEGLLCRMYLGWPRTNTALDRGAAELLKVAPFRSDDYSFYYWYYATQVMHHLGGEAWSSWNDEMKVQLPAMQVKQMPEAGSWTPGGGTPFDQMAGRLYCTCMSMYCLEVYYRHLPIYDAPLEVNDSLRGSESLVP